MGGFYTLGWKRATISAMSETPESSQPARKRRWFQFHLSTLVVFVLVAGALVHLDLSEDGPYKTSYGWPYYEGSSYGWPWAAYEIRHKFPRVLVEGHFTLAKEGRVIGEGLLGDILFAVFVLAAVGVLCEVIIRRKKHQASGYA
jgi:hypothetical protein